MFRIQHECPQCGAGLELGEDDRLIVCQFCNVRHFLSSDDLRFAIPPMRPAQHIVYLPYLRFFGAVFSVTDQGIKVRMTDVTKRALEFKQAAETLGVRTESIRIRFAATAPPGTFLQITSTVDQLMGRITKADGLAHQTTHELAANREAERDRRMFEMQEQAMVEDVGAQFGVGGLVSTALLGSDAPIPQFPVHQKIRILRREFVGETVSTVYLPLLLENNQVIDGVNGTVLGPLPASGAAFFNPAVDPNPVPSPSVLACLCVHCGAEIGGGRNSVVLTCANCQRAWRPVGDQVQEVEVQHVPGPPGSIYLPFWRLQMAFDGIDLADRASLRQFSGKLGQSQFESENSPPHFWCAAFKVHPQQWVLPALRLTQKQPFDQAEEGVPEAQHYPANLPVHEASQFTLVTLAELAKSSRERLESLADVQMKMRHATLFYLPFERQGPQLVMRNMGLTFMTRAIETGQMS